MSEFVQSAWRDPERPFHYKQLDSYELEPEQAYDCPECGASFDFDPETITCGQCTKVTCAECERTRCEGCGEHICGKCTHKVGELDYCSDCQLEGAIYAWGVAVEEYSVTAMKAASMVASLARRWRR